MRYVNVTTVDDIYQAQFVSHALEEEGIMCIQANEPTNTLLPYLRQGIQIRVMETDYLRAKVICDRAEEMRRLRCPNCDSTRLKYVGHEEKKRRWWQVLASLLHMPSFLFADKPVLVYRCINCNTQFKTE